MNQIDIKKVQKSRVEEDKEKEGSLWERYEATEREREKRERVTLRERGRDR